MEIALIHNNQLILGPMGFNVRMINSELEDFEVEERVTTQSYTELPIHCSDGLTHILLLEKVVPENNSKYDNIGNFTWEIIRENNTPIKVVLTYPIIKKTLEEVKYLKKLEVSPVRREKENTIITLSINNTNIEVSTSREERLLLASKLAASPGPHNFKFKNTWLEITTEQLQYIVSEIDSVIQEAFDWELQKIQEIDACETIDDVYDVVIREELPVQELLPE